MLLPNTCSARSYTISTTHTVSSVELNEHNKQLLNQQRTTRALVSVFYIIMQHEACTSVINEQTGKSTPKTSLPIHIVHRL